MRNLSGSVSAALVVVAAASAASAAPLERGLYAGAFGSLSGPDTSFDYKGGSDDATYSIGGGGGAFIGYALGNGLRFEGEFAVRQSDIDNVDTSIAASDGGDTRTDTLFANLIYDFSTGMRFSPYVGAGVGVAHVSHGLVRTVAGSSVHDDYYTLAGQAIAGGSYAISPTWSAFADYRLMLTASGDVTTTSGTDVDSKLYQQSINIGFSRHF